MFAEYSQCMKDIYVNEKENKKPKQDIIPVVKQIEYG